MNDNTWVWGLRWRRALNSIELEEFLEFWCILCRYKMDKMEAYSFNWKCSSDGVFSTKSMYNLLFKEVSAEKEVDPLLIKLWCKGTSSKINLVETIVSAIVNLPIAPFLFEALIEIMSSKFMAPDESEPPRAGKMSADDVWNDIMAGNQQQPKKEMMTLEDFLLKAEKGASSGVAVVEPKEEGSSGWICDRMNSIGEESMGRARAKRSFSLSAAPHKAVEVRERRMIKNRESAARSRERKQAYEAELESMAVRLEEENEVLLKEKVEYKKKRLEKLMQSVIPVTEMRRPAHILQKTGSM